jgi:hypothetical protein
MLFDIVNGNVHWIAFPFHVVGHNIASDGQFIEMKLFPPNKLWGKIRCQPLKTKFDFSKDFTSSCERLAFSCKGQIDKTTNFSTHTYALYPHAISIYSLLILKCVKSMCSVFLFVVLPRTSSGSSSYKWEPTLFLGDRQCSTWAPHKGGSMWLCRELQCTNCFTPLCTSIWRGTIYCFILSWSFVAVV